MSRPVTGTIHHVPFYSADPDLSYTHFNSNMGVDIFTVTNGTLTVPVSSAVKNTVSLSSPVLGVSFDNLRYYYQFRYIPDIPGYYLFAASGAGVSLVPTYVIDGVDIDSEDSFVSLSQDTGPNGDPVPGYLVPKISNPQNYILMVFLSSDWQVGRYDPLYAVSSTELDSKGNWLSTPLYVTHQSKASTNNSYHVVVQANDGTKIVVAAFLEV